MSLLKESTMNNIEFVRGKKVQHAYTKEYLWMLKEGREQILCRTKDLREIWFYPYELEVIQSDASENQLRNKRFL